MPTHADTAIGELIRPMVGLGMLKITAQTFNDLGRPTEALVARLVK